MNDGISFTKFNNHELLERMRVSTSHNLIYGDWGSKRPREEPKIMMTPLKRIDFPVARGWHVARNKGADWNFQEAAKNILMHPEWNPNLTTFGTRMIEDTASSEV